MSALIAFFLGMLGSALIAAIPFIVSSRFRLFIRQLWRESRRASSSLLHGLDSDPKIVPGTRTINMAIVTNGTSPYVLDLEYAFVAEAKRILLDHNIILHVEREIGSNSIDIDENKIPVQAVCSRFLSGPDFIVTIGTGVSSYVRKELPKIPQIFLAVTDPIESGLVRSLTGDAARGPVAGVSFSVGATDRLEFVNEVFHPRKIGFVYNSDILADVHQLDAFIAACPLIESTAGIEIVPIECTDAILPDLSDQDLDVLLGWLHFHEHISSFINQSEIPVIGGGWVDLRKGASCCISDDERQLGRIAADRILAKHIINNKPLSLMPIMGASTSANNRLFTGFNLDAAQRWNLSFPQKMLDQANYVVYQDSDS